STTSYFKRTSTSKQRPNFVRKWSQTFVKNHWIVATTFLVLLLVGISIAVGWALRVGSFEAVQNLDAYLLKGSPI
ncbi:uncharacterized protein B0H18DRAFT_1207091, partial [Fomitopsis serialis]|uniref:uncharacterized protein n=1 Tax=Fomitopsis serialis TaxID=139415 RepID=UPI002007A941